MVNASNHLLISVTGTLTQSVLGIHLIIVDGEEMTTLINNWAELKAVPDSATHRLSISIGDGNGWIVNKETGKHERYLSTHTFYGLDFEYSTKLLQEHGFDVQLANWDA